jgi:4-amino-4-deoxy-L-arabinose transferase-like glycosyltransferase
MTDTRRFRLIDLSLVLLVLAVATAARGWYLVQCADAGGGPGPIRVQRAVTPWQLTDASLSALRAAGLPEAVLQKVEPLKGQGFPRRDDFRAELGKALGEEDLGHYQDLLLEHAAAPDDRGALVRNLRERGSFSGPAPLAAGEEQTAHVAPGYPWLLSVAGLTAEPDRVVRWSQAGLGALTAVLYFLFARRAFGHRLVAALAGLFCALHPFWVVSAAEVEDGVLAAFLLGLAVWLGARGGQGGGALTSLLYGLVLAGLALVRAALLPFAFVAVLWFLWRCRSLPRGWLYALLAFLGFANALVPWGLRNYQMTGDVVPVVDSAWWHLWVGNSPLATGGPQDEDALRHRLAEARGQTPAELRRSLDELPQQQRYRRLAQDVVDEVQHNPGATLNRRLWAGVSFVFGEEWLRNRTVWQLTSSVGNSPVWLAQSYPAILLGALLGMLLLAFAGWRWTYGWRRESMPAALAVAWVPLPYLLGHAEALAGPRLPLDGVFLCYAAFALAYLLPRVGGYLRNGPPTAFGDSGAV